MNAKREEAKCIFVFVMPLFSMSFVKKASDATPPAGRKTLTKLRFRNKSMVKNKGTLLFTEASANLYINP